MTWLLFTSDLIATSVGVQALVSTLLILAASYAFHFDIMWQNSFWLSFLLLLLTNLALVSFCLFIRCSHHTADPCFCGCLNRCCWACFYMRMQPLYMRFYSSQAIWFVVHCLCAQASKPSEKAAQGCRVKCCMYHVACIMLHVSCCMCHVA